MVDCLDSLDFEAQVCSSKLGPNIMYYLPTLFHFLTNKANMANQPSPGSDHKREHIEEKDPPDCNMRPRLTISMLREV